MNSWPTLLGGPTKTATRFEMPLCTRSAASSAPAPSESSDKTMMSADATGSFTTSAHPAARRTGSRMDRIAMIANAANARTARIGEAHLGHLKIILGFIRLLHESAISPGCWHVPPAATRSTVIFSKGAALPHPFSVESAISPLRQFKIHNRSWPPSVSSWPSAAAPRRIAAGRDRAFPADG